MMSEHETPRRPEGQREEAPRPTLAEEARTLLAMARRAVLSTADADTDYPYPSLVEVLPTDDGDLVLFLSRLAAHTRNLEADRCAGLLVLERSDAQDTPLAHGRVTVQGDMIKLEDGQRFRQAYLEAHPHASTYIDFPDFAFYRLWIRRARFIAGFGRMGWLTAEDLRQAQPDPLREVAAGAIAHMNEDHGQSLLDYARAFAPEGVDRGWVERARMTALDRLGYELELVGEGGERVERARLGFDEPLEEPERLRGVMVELARRAREKLGQA